MSRVFRIRELLKTLFVPWATLSIVAVAGVVLALDRLDIVGWPILCDLFCVGSQSHYADTLENLPEHPFWEIIALFGSQFLHAGIWHLAQNAIAILVFGWFVEKHFVETGIGRLGYSWRVLLLGSAAGAVPWGIMVFSYNSGVSIGMSCSVFAVMGIFLWIRTPLWVKVVLGGYVFYRVVMNIATLKRGHLFLSEVSWPVPGHMPSDEFLLAMMGISMSGAHLAGFVLGVIVGLAHRAKRLAPFFGKWARAVSAAGYFLPPLALGAVAHSFFSSRPDLDVRRHGTWAVLVWVLLIADFSFTFLFDLPAEHRLSRSIFYSILTLLIALFSRAIMGVPAPGCGRMRSAPALGFRHGQAQSSAAPATASNTPL